MNAMERTDGVAHDQPLHARGIALLSCLLMLLLMTLLAVSAMQNNLMQERMTGNVRDRQVALQAAEAALREAEELLAAGPALVFGNAHGLWQPAADPAMDRWQGVDWARGGTDTREISAGLDVFAGLSRPPAFIIEQIPPDPHGGHGSEPGEGTAVASQPQLYRITASGWGGRESSHVVVQSVYGAAPQGLPGPGPGPGADRFGRQSWKQLQ